MATDPAPGERYPPRFGLPVMKVVKLASATDVAAADA